MYALTSCDTINSNVHACVNFELRITSASEKSPETRNVHPFVHIMLVYLNDTAVVSFGKVSDDQKSQAQESGVTIYAWEEFLNLVS